MELWSLLSGLKIALFPYLAQNSRHINDYALRTNDQGAALGVRTDSVELGVGVFLSTDARGIFWRPKIIDEFGANEKYPFPDLLFFTTVPAFVIVGDRGVIGLWKDLRKSPAFSAVVSKSQVWTVLFWQFVVAAGDHTVGRVAESDGKNSG